MGKRRVVTGQHAPRGQTPDRNMLTACQGLQPEILCPPKCRSLMPPLGNLLCLVTQQHHCLLRLLKFGKNGVHRNKQNTKMYFKQQLLNFFSFVKGGNFSFLHFLQYFQELFQRILRHCNSKYCDIEYICF